MALRCRTCRRPKLHQWCQRRWAHRQPTRSRRRCRLSHRQPCPSSLVKRRPLPRMWSTAASGSPSRFLAKRRLVSSRICSQGLGPPRLDEGAKAPETLAADGGFCPLTPSLPSPPRRAARPGGRATNPQEFRAAAERRSRPTAPRRRIAGRRRSTSPGSRREANWPPVGLESLPSSIPDGRVLPERLRGSRGPRHRGVPSANWHPRSVLF